MKEKGETINYNDRLYNFANFTILFIIA